MEKYHGSEEILQRTNKNDNLYDELYREKQELTSNVTVLDNVNEIDINKIKEMVDSRENYKKVRKYEDLINSNETVMKDKIKYDFDEINDEDYDINQILKRKRIDMTDENNKIRKVDLSDIDLSVSKDNNDYESRDEQIKELVHTIVGDDSIDLFANLKQTSVEINTEEDKEDKTEIVKETTFYTSTNSFKNKDFKDNIDEKEEENNTGATILSVITILALLIAIGVFIWYKFFK